MIFCEGGPRWSVRNRTASLSLNHLSYALLEPRVAVVANATR